MQVLGIIPARYASTRFPGKPLALIDGKPMIQHVWENVSRIGVIDRAIVATDDARIAEAVSGFGGEVRMTSSSHRSGTDRCGEVLESLGAEADGFDVVVNIQGDEPLVNDSQIVTVAQAFENPDVEIATLKKLIVSEEQLFSPNVVKVTDTPQGWAICFSRNPIPYLRGVEREQWLSQGRHYKHIGIYAFRTATLRKVVRLAQTPLELSESLEQLRWLENGFRIAVRETTVENLSVDTPEDLQKIMTSFRPTV